MCFVSFARVAGTGISGCQPPSDHASMQKMDSLFQFHLAKCLTSP